MSATRSAPVFAINHMVTPNLRPQAFFQLARSLDLQDVEIRNDLSGNAITDGTPAAEIRAQAAEVGVKIATINALQRFNEWTPEREQEAITLADYAREAGAAALVLVPVNDGTGQKDGERQANLRVALKALLPILDERGLKGFVEPLGFEICSLRSKREAVEAIKDVNGQGTFRVVHDTFHHHLAGEPALFPEWTGLVHISGVTDAAVSVSDMRDSHRVLVDAQDRLGNVAQIRALLDAGYTGLFSFEPFAEEVQALEKPAAALSESIALIRHHLA
ncbi:TIM barrel protein [Phyllobacterium sp. TAF24]|uniref:TIM barrel protein n=1 Tax=Phyllobacterium sp. TAF24 TaxID=3233068 RepID=UPI003F9AE08A